eukprot:4145996-Pyramimonas_sp.AAC.2
MPKFPSTKATVPTPTSVRFAKKPNFGAALARLGAIFYFWRFSRNVFLVCVTLAVHHSLSVSLGWGPPLRPSPLLVRSKSPGEFELTCTRRASKATLAHARMIDSDAMRKLCLETR